MRTVLAITLILVAIVSFAAAFRLDRPVVMNDEAPVANRPAYIDELLQKARALREEITIPKIPKFPRRPICQCIKAPCNCGRPIIEKPIVSRPLVLPVEEESERSPLIDDINKPAVEKPSVNVFDPERPVAPKPYVLPRRPWLTRPFPIDRPLPVIEKEILYRPQVLPTEETEASGEKKQIDWAKVKKIFQKKHSAKKQEAAAETEADMQIIDDIKSGIEKAKEMFRKWRGSKKNKKQTEEEVVEAMSEGAESGKASYYANSFNGRRTANGETFSNSASTCAHKTLPFGTIVHVTNTANGRSTTCRVNDRGPYSAGRIIDLTSAVFSRLAPISQGVLSVRISY